MFENLKFFWRSSSCSPYGFIRHQEIGNIWLKNAIQTNNQDLNYNIHQEKIRQFPKFDGAERQKGKKADSDFQSVFPDMILASTSDLLKWFFSFRKMLKGILVELWMSFVDISWCLCGHFAWFWLGICLRSSFPNEMFTGAQVSPENLTRGQNEKKCSNKSKHIFKYL